MGKFSPKSDDAPSKVEQTSEVFLLIIRYSLFILHFILPEPEKNFNLPPSPCLQEIKKIVK